MSDGSAFAGYPAYSGVSGAGIGAVLVAGGWTRDAGPPAVVRLTTITDQVGIGTASPGTGIKLDIVGTTRTQGRIVAVIHKVFADSGYTATANDYAVLWDPTGGACVQNLPVAVEGSIYVIKHDSASANTVTVTPNGAQTIDGAPNLVLATRGSCVLLGVVGVGWSVVG